MPNAYPLSPASDPFNPSLLDAPQEDAAVHCELLSYSSSNSVGFPDQMRFNICPSAYLTGIWADNPRSAWKTSKSDDNERWHPCQVQLIDKEQSQIATTTSLMLMPDVGKRVSVPLTTPASSTSLVGKDESLEEDATREANGCADTGRTSSKLNPDSRTVDKNGKRTSTNNSNRGNSDNITTFNFKTEYCSKFRKSGQCPFGERCRFVHHEHELQPRKRPLTYKTQYCMAGKSCPYQRNHARCDFLHEGETAEMFNKQRGVPYTTVMNILKQKLERRQHRDRRLHQQQQEQEATTGEDHCSETLSETTDVQQYDSSEMSPLDPELPVRLLSVLGIDVSPTSTCSTSLKTPIARASEPPQEPLHSSEQAMPKTFMPGAEDLLVAPGHCHEWVGPFRAEQDIRGLRRTSDLSPPSTDLGSGNVLKRYALAGHLLTFLTSKSEYSTGYYKLW